MVKFQKVVAVLMIFALLGALFGCSGGKKTALKKYESWFVDKYEPAYQSYIKSGKAQNAPSTDLSLLIASDDYVKLIFAYIRDGSRPVYGEVTEKDGVYTYSEPSFKQVVEFSGDKTAMKITMYQLGEEGARVEFIAAFVQQGSHYYLQFLAPEFRDYAEVRFTAKSGRAIRRGDLSALPYDIFSSDIPSGFAKEK